VLGILCDNGRKKSHARNAHSCYWGSPEQLLLDGTLILFPGSCLEAITFESNRAVRLASVCTSDFLGLVVGWGCMALAFHAVGLGAKPIVSSLGDGEHFAVSLDACQLGTWTSCR
jgi:hypothetical protein